MMKGRTGFSVSELLVVLALLGVTVGLLLPAVQKSRADADKTKCADNLRRLGAASIEYATAHSDTIPANRVTVPHGSWNTLLLPYVGEEKLSRDYDPGKDWWQGVNRTVGATPVSVFQCPASPKLDRTVLTTDPDGGKEFRTAPTDYVGSAGAYYQTNDPKNLHPGAMHFRTVPRPLRTSDIQDGTGYTLLVVEMADKPNHWRTGKLDEDRSDKAQSPQLNGQWAAPNWNHLRSYSVDGKTGFGPCAVNCSNSASIYGFHEGGANCLFVDGSVKFLKAGLSQEMLIALVSIAGGEVLSPGDF
jgi:prepilin-type processing-associated H-X9-DG protein